MTARTSVFGITGFPDSEANQADLHFAPPLHKEFQLLIVLL